ncbi:hypothetical protein GCM10009039_33150 [Halocalculus aciditolerans]|uniref:Uncharacterized protein n=1 Tax=Halocalculus aciditolerans TaxID=1383812 RepID=A0A830FN73_9EURY|nr:hypothetical protein GCM10009039_33150 [Halocalculus aciditolerans]
MSRAVSTPLDAALAVLLVAAAIAVLVAAQPPSDPAPSPHRVADAVLPVTANVSCTGRAGRVRAPLGDLLASAAANRTPPACAARAAERALGLAVPRANLTLVTTGQRVLAAGPPPHGDRVRAATAALPGAPDATLVVRTWSP